ncbi:ZIP family metal transporter [Phaeocystidibacter luteus]|uniref:ZIP family metal transporter n=1 Tax=Phaeocystidibacter luteus TaxID=911197 RepID=A0A6N6RMD9_9FLAO|nr:ZIP family metal transporter [Phaeocystidibacter luteus]KAB2814712.1 ZIP family metal transporter [Phaeocystidibacter luteus]
MPALVFFLSVWVGVLLASVIRKNASLGTSILLAFSGAFLFSVSVLHLIPELYEGHSHMPGLFILIGFISQFLMDFLSRGVEHGHHHSSDVMRGALPVGIFVGLFVHAFLEGLPTFGMDDVSLRGFVIAVALHKVPVAMVLYLLLREANVSGMKLWSSMLLFSAMAPLGSITMSYFPSIQEWMPEINAFVIGIFLHVSTTILYESSKDHKFNVRKLVVVITGAVLAWITIQH